MKVYLPRFVSCFVFFTLVMLVASPASAGKKAPPPVVSLNCGLISVMPASTGLTQVYADLEGDQIVIYYNADTYQFAVSNVRGLVVDASKTTKAGSVDFYLDTALPCTFIGGKGANSIVFGNARATFIGGAGASIVTFGEGDNWCINLGSGQLTTDLGANAETVVVLGSATSSVFSSGGTGWIFELCPRKVTLSVPETGFEVIDNFWEVIAFICDNL